MGNEKSIFEDELMFILVVHARIKCLRGLPSWVPGKAGDREGKQLRQCPEGTTNRREPINGERWQLYTICRYSKCLVLNVRCVRTEVLLVGKQHQQS